MDEEHGHQGPNLEFYNNQQRQQQGQGPQTPPTWNRTARMLAGFIPATAAMMAILMGVEAIAPPNAKPSLLVGTWMGNLHTAEVNAQSDADVKNAGRLAQANANAQMTIIELQNEMAMIKEALAAKIQESNAADIACVAGPLAAQLLFYPGTDADRTSRQVGQAACMLAVQLREQIVREQAQLARDFAMMQQMGGR